MHHERDTAMTKAEFVRRWLDFRKSMVPSGLTVEDLRRVGRYPKPCNCGDFRCHGWQMVFAAEDMTPEEFRAYCERGWTMPDDWSPPGGYTDV